MSEGTEVGTSLTAVELRQRREAAGLSTYELAERVGVSPGYIQQLEQGRKPIPPARAEQICGLLAGLAGPAATRMPGGELRRVREHAGLALADLGAMFGVSKQAIAAWERDGVPVEHAEALAVAAAAPSFAGGLLRAERERVRLKQVELVGELSRRGMTVSQSCLSRWERGERAIPPDAWRAIRAVIRAAGEPPPRERPVSGGAITRRRAELRMTQGELAELLGVKTSAVGAWEAGIKRVPPRRWRHIREVLAQAQPVPDRLGRVLELVLAVVQEHSGGISRTELIARVAADAPRVRAAVRRGLADGLVHEARVACRRSDGVIRYLPCLFAGRPTGELRVDRLASVVEQVVESVERDPGRTARAVANALRHDRRLGLDAIARAIEEGRLVLREVRSTAAHGPRTRVGVFGADAAPAKQPPWRGRILRELREQLLFHRGDFARMLGVGRGTLSRWERSELPGAWVPRLARLVDPVGGGSVIDPERFERERREAFAQLDDQILSYVDEHPGTSWGPLVRHLPIVFGPYVARRVRELLASGRLHEKARVNGRGGGLFAGPGPEIAPLAPAELQALCARAGSQRALAAAIGAGVGSINQWLKGEPIPSYRIEQLRNLFAVTAP